MGRKIDLKQRRDVMDGCDIIVPVYDAYDCLVPCINSVLKNTDLKINKLILIDDKSPDERVLPLLEKYEKENKGKIVLLRNEKNLGFVKTVNRGMKYSKRNVLLLNSDTLVSSGWLKRIVECSKQDAGIATVTPFSNNLTPIKPLPESFRKEGFPDGYDLRSMAELVKNCSMKLYPEIPTSHGFCMYIKREALDVVGYFDEITFGKGYGEENDFCFRCLDYGYKHVVCDDVYIFHKGTQSFLGNKKLHNNELVKKHPKIMKMVGKWYEKQDIEKITDNIVLAIGVKEKRVNILVTVKDKLTKKDLEILDKLRAKCNFHILEEGDGSFVLRSFFEKVDLKTAIYKKGVIFCENKIESKEYKKMIDEIMDIFGISVMFESIDEESILKECKNKGRKKNIDFLRAREKMLEYDFLQNIMRGIDIKRREDEDKRMRSEQKELKLEQEREERENREWRENLTIPQRIYLKIRFILMGR